MDEETPDNFLATFTLVLGSVSIAINVYSFFFSPVLYNGYPVAFIGGALAAVLGWVALRNPHRQIQAVIGMVCGFVAFLSSFTPISF